MTSTEATAKTGQRVRVFGNLGRNVERLETKPRVVTKRIYDPIIEETVEAEVEEPGREFKTFSLAINYSENGRQHTRWIKVLDFNTPSVIPHLVRKGDRVGVEGTMQQRSYRDREGQLRTETQIIAERVSWERMTNIPEIP